MKVQWDSRAKVVFLSVLLSLQGIAMGQEGTPRTSEFNIHSLPATHVKPLAQRPPRIRVRWSITEVR